MVTVAGKVGVLFVGSSVGAPVVKEMRCLCGTILVTLVVRSPAALLGLLKAPVIHRLSHFRIEN